jgi:flagellar FliL protein
MTRNREKQHGRRLWVLIVTGAALFHFGGLIPEVSAAEEKAAAPPKAAEAPAAPAPAKPAPVAKPLPPAKAAPVVVDLDPFLVNLADTAQTRFAKITIKLESSASGFSEQMDEHLHQVRDSLLLLISSKRYDDIRTVEGKLDLRSNIVERVNAILGGEKASAAYFTEFVIQ